MNAQSAINPAAPAHLPGFLAGPDGSDLLLVLTGIGLVAMILAFGLIFLTLHTLPDRMAHRGQKLQFEIVAVLGLIALFTNEHIFWIIALILALVDLPDLVTPLRRIAASSERIAGLPPSNEEEQRPALGDGSTPPPTGRDKT